MRGVKGIEGGEKREREREGEREGESEYSRGDGRKECNKTK